jgi:hypothetical protein
MIQLTADSWPGARPQIVTSANGAYRFKTRPPQLATWSGKSNGTVVRVAPDGSETAIWSRELVNIPVIGFISGDGQHVVTFDTWAKLGYEHALVIYGEQGSVVVDYDLEALLSPDEIGTSVHQTIGARRWLQAATIAFDQGERGIVIRLQWGKTIRVVLETGKIETAL